MRLSDGPIQYYDVGSGEPILFVHGAFVNGGLWRNVCKPLSRDFRCLVPTLPLGGHQIAMDPDADLTPKGLVGLLTEFLDELGVDRVTLVGNDTGGALCQVFLAEHPDRVERLVLTNCDAFDNFPPLAARPFTLAARIPGLVELFAFALRSDRIRRLAFKILAKHPIHPQTLSTYVESLSNNTDVQRDLRKVLLGVSSRYTTEAAKTFSAFDGPVLIVWAPEDPVFPLEDAEKLVESFPNAQLRQVQNSYAFIAEDQPERLTKLLSEFLEAPLPTSS
ncbi:alpha/beta fold hydrolase [Haloprofundus marisrubri]|nr:alpha/beta hydrolase [Haloprofundus marisrubri]